MSKKLPLSVVSAAILMASLGHLSFTAAANMASRGTIPGVSMIPTVGTGLHRPTPGAASLNGARLTPRLTVPSLQAAPSLITPAPIAAPAEIQAQALPLAAQAMPAMAEAAPLAAITAQGAKIDIAEKSAALNGLFDNAQAVGPQNSEVRAPAQVERSRPAPSTKFKSAKQVAPAIAKIKELFSGVRMWGYGDFKPKAGPLENLRSVHVSPTGKPQADRVTISIGYNWGVSDSWTNLYVTLIGGDKPALLVQENIDEVPFEPGAKMPKTGIIKNAELSVKKAAVTLRVTQDDGSKKSYIIQLRPDGNVWFKEIDASGTVHIILLKK
ncbi:MAG: hypothetical protein WC881_09725 [Elusimicrobiota bacterium]|jgi:hypothetical protein